MSQLHRLVYTSVRKPNCDDTEIEKILDSCRKNNPGRNITGVLVHSDKRFLQYIEGEKKDLEELFELIKKDDRHAAVNQRNFEPIDKRIFPSWQMGYKDLSSELAFHSDASTEDQKIIKALINDEMDFSNQGLKVLQLFFKT